MARPRRRRFEGRPIEGAGKNARSLRPRKNHLQFYSALSGLNYHFDNWLLPREREEAAMTSVILALQNILEYETELAILSTVSPNSSRRDRKLKKGIQERRASFTTKFEWLRDKRLISRADVQVMEAIRDIRNEHAHWRPSATRRELKYFGTPLLTSKAVKQILLDVQPIVEKLRGISGSKETLAVIPGPSFFAELDRIGRSGTP